MHSHGPNFTNTETLLPEARAEVVLVKIPSIVVTKQQLHAASKAEGRSLYESSRGPSPKLNLLSLAQFYKYRNNIARTEVVLVKIPSAVLTK